MKRLFCVSVAIACAMHSAYGKGKESGKEDYYGKIGFAYQWQDESWKADGDFADDDNNGFSAIALLGGKTEIGRGLDMGIEIAGWSDFGWDLAGAPRVEAERGSGAEISQAYLEYSLAAIGIKAGRQELSKELSPWAWTSHTAGVADWVYDGLIMKYELSTDTSVSVGWVSQMSHNSDEELDMGDSSGMFLLSLLDSSFEKTRIALSAYYIPKSGLNTIYSATASTGDTWSLWGSIVGGDSLRFGLQGAFVGGEIDDMPSGRSWNSTCAIAARVSAKIENFDISLAVSYINDGDYSLRAAGSGREDGALWTDNEMSADGYGADQWAFLTKASYDFSGSSIYGTLGYWDFDRHTFRGDEKRAGGARLGYKFSAMGLDAKIEYRYRRVEYYNPATLARTRQRIRLEAYYDF